MFTSDRIKLHNCPDTGKIPGNFLSKYRNKETKKLNEFTAIQFLDVWNYFDTDGNGYIEDSELDKFLLQFVTSVVSDNVGNEVVSQAAFNDMKTEFLAAYDDNGDGRIEIGELTQILPTDEEFLVLFQREHPLTSSIEFMKVWKRFDKDCSGFIEADELSNFIRYLFENSCKKITDYERKIDYYTDIMLKLFDRNCDGKLQLSEMARLLPIKQNYIARPMFSYSQKISCIELERIFNAYDEDSNGQMEGDELKALLMDVMELCGEIYNNESLAKLENIILSEWDVNHDGKINKKEFKMILTQHSKLGDVERKPYSRIILKNM